MQTTLCLKTTQRPLQTLAVKPVG